jgi:leucyl-tRNA synthetase
MVLNQGIKMSKSKGNTVDPGPLIEKYGTDTVRLFSMFAAPPDQNLEWSDSGVEGSFRFLKRLWTLAHENEIIIRKQNQNKDANVTMDWDKTDTQQREALRQIYDILEQAKYDYERLQFNTVVSGCMKLFNILAKIPGANSASVDLTPYIMHKGMSFLLRLLAPIAPHITHQLWQDLGYEGIIINAAWPKASAQLLKIDQIEMVVQINGKLRSRIHAPTDAEAKVVEKIALDDAKVQAAIADKMIKKIITVPGKLINIVTGEK